MHFSEGNSALLNHPPVQRRTGKLRAFVAVLLGVAAAACILSTVKSSERDTGAFLAPVRPPAAAPRVPASQMADFPWEEGFKWPWEKTEKAKEAAVKVESPETTADELPEPAPESDAARAGDPEMQTRAGDPQMRAGSPQMMADFPWEEGFKWPWEKTEKAKEAAAKVESPETTADELPEPVPESTE